MTATIRQRKAGSTKRGVADDYDGTNPNLCNARTKSGRPCRALKLRGGRCKWHGGLSTGPRTAEGKARCTTNLPWAKC
ncbi:HGGxSTG domain-containing protein [Metallibacterium scheffleri]|uniref:HGGxSTG domain-containing protein n=1 Tax=Metallibacterium scheffleri TaxID=993689 RepID=UPI003CCCBF7A